MVFSGVIEDDSSSIWVSFFNKQAEILLGATADEAYTNTYQDGFHQDVYDSYFAKATFTEWIFKCKVKNEIVNNEPRMKVSVVTLHPVDYIKESLDMLTDLNSF
jgi:replication factor A1